MSSFEHKVKLPDLNWPGLQQSQDCWAPSTIRYIRAPIEQRASRPFSTPLLLRLGIQRMAGWSINLPQRMHLSPSYLLLGPITQESAQDPWRLAGGTTVLSLHDLHLSRPLLRLSYGRQDPAKWAWCSWTGFSYVHNLVILSSSMQSFLICLFHVHGAYLVIGAWYRRQEMSICSSRPPSLW